jgi:hypothetical protein
VFATQARAWDALTQPQRDAWNAAAAQRQTRPRCGQSGPMTGLQFFVQINANLVLFGLDTVHEMTNGYTSIPTAFSAIVPQSA